MQISKRSLVVFAGAIAIAATSYACAEGTVEGPPADSPNATPPAANVMADLSNDIGQVEGKFISLAKAIPADKYDWRPGAGVRSVGELMLHVAADNYLIPGSIGAPIDSAVGIKAGDYNTAMAFEKRKLSRDSIVAELERSFAFLKQAMANASPAGMSEKVSMFGMEFSKQQAWILNTTHIHEHLGQAIAYARSNNVVPPWSK